MKMRDGDYYQAQLGEIGAVGLGLGIGSGRFWSEVPGR